jgi:hypothetical protein
VPFNTKTLVRDVDGHAIPQYFNPDADQYEALLGKYGASRVLLYDANGNPLLTQGNPGYVDMVDRAARVLGKVSADDGAITAMGAKGDAAVTDPTLSASQIALLKGLLKQLQGNGTGAQNVTLTGSNAMQLPDVVVNNLAAGASFTESTWNDVQGFNYMIVTVIETGGSNGNTAYYEHHFNDTNTGNRVTASPGWTQTNAGVPQYQKVDIPLRYYRSYVKNNDTVTATFTVKRRARVF